MEEKKAAKAHKMMLDNRKSVSLTGVVDVHAFDEETITLMTECGKLQIKGEMLHVKGLDLEAGELEIQGKVNSFSYLSKKVRKKGEFFLQYFFR